MVYYDQVLCTRNKNKCTEKWTVTRLHNLFYFNCFLKMVWMLLFSTFSLCQIFNTITKVLRLKKRYGPICYLFFSGIHERLRWQSPVGQDPHHLQRLRQRRLVFRRRSAQGKTMKKTLKLTESYFCYIFFRAIFIQLAIFNKYGHENFSNISSSANIVHPCEVFYLK